MVGNFNIKHDLEIVSAGGFFCQGCLIGKPTQDKSLDDRYCRVCFTFLLAEARLLEGRRPSWVPRTTKEPPNKADKGPQNNVQTRSGNDKPYTGLPIGVQEVSTILSTVETRGRKQIPLPLDRIDQLTKEGMGSKAIASTLKAEGIRANYRTVARVINGRRNGT